MRGVTIDILTTNRKETNYSLAWVAASSFFGVDDLTVAILEQIYLYSSSDHSSLLTIVIRIEKSSHEGKRGLSFIDLE